MLCSLLRFLKFLSDLRHGFRLHILLLPFRERLDMLQPGGVQTDGRGTIDWSADPTFTRSADLRRNGERKTNIGGDGVPEGSPFRNGAVRV
jgi:hypothetical protein